MISLCTCILFEAPQLLFLNNLILAVGTSKATEPYKLGKRTTDIMLEILNLNKTEVLSIDTISNQDFTEVIEYVFHVLHHDVQFASLTF